MTPLQRETAEMLETLQPFEIVQVMQFISSLKQQRGKKTNGVLFGLGKSLISGTVDPDAGSREIEDMFEGKSDEE